VNPTLTHKEEECRRRALETLERRSRSTRTHQPKDQHFPAEKKPHASCVGPAAVFGGALSVGPGLNKLDRKIDAGKYADANVNSRKTMAD
jgi:hypothetical protein